MSDTDIRVENLKDRLKSYLTNLPEVVAAWEGGSAATGYLDEFSDLDLSIVIQDSEPDTLFSALESFFSQHYGILNSFRMPEPCWHGMSQCFYLLAGMPEMFYCDIVVVKSDNPRKFTEPERHGKAIIWFDKNGLYSNQATPPEELAAMAKHFYHVATDTSFLGIIELQKALARGNWIASQMNYMMFLNRHLVILLNLKYRPEKVDFGIRYSDRDYPPEVVAQLENYLKISRVEDISQHLQTALPLFEELKSQMQEIYC